MKKSTLTFAALAAAAASFASAENMPQTGGEQGMFPGLQEVQYQGVKPASKNDDRVKFIYVAENVNAVPAAPEPAPAAEPLPGAEGTPAEPLPQNNPAPDVQP